MQIGIIGASGGIGQRVIDEALLRGHHVIGFTRDVTKVDPQLQTPLVVWKELDAYDPDSVRPHLKDLDVLISLFQPGNASRDIRDTIAKSIAHPTAYAEVARSLLDALKSKPRLRLIVVGGAGSLEISPGVTLADSPEALSALLEKIGIPQEYEVAVRGHRDALNVYRLSNRLWTYLSPAGHIFPGERTGRFRLGSDQPVTDANGDSKISFEDCAVALLDEVEIPQFIQRRFTIGY